MLGEYKAIYEARTNIPELRSGRQSGDIITTLCVFLLEKGMINSVLAVKMDNSRPYKAIATIARSRFEVLQCAGSKYCYINYGKLPLMLDEKSALVGLPCQMPRRRTPYLKIGLFCGLNTADSKLEYLLKWRRIAKEEIVYFDWRSPKNRLIEVQVKSGKVCYFEHWFLNFFFPRPQCLRCADYSSHFADISVGDRTPGTSAVIIRTDKGHEIFTRAVIDGYIKAKEISLRSFLEHRMSPMLQKELRGGFIKVPFVRCYGKWINFIPPAILKFVGLKIASYLKRFSREDTELMIRKGEKL
ncbi:MAG: Coenzyme F420 hydrogenase/dehydrogenase, beta subunit C-terminal domain [Candidatus Helarchaeota archaeon]